MLGRFRLARRPIRLELPVRLDRSGIDAGELRYAPGERGELHRLEKGDQPLVVGLVHRQLGERHLELDVGIERDQPFREPRLLGVLDQRLAPLLLLDLAGTRQQRFEIAIFADKLRGGLDPDARHARHVVGGIPDQRLHLDELLRRHAEFFDHLGNADAAIFHGVVHDHAVGHELHEVLVGGDDGRAGAHVAGLAHIGGDQVVGLVAELFQTRNVERAHRFANEGKLRTQIVGRVRPVRFVIGIHLVAEGLLRLVEHDREVGRPLFGLHVAQELPQHVAEAEHGIDLQPIGLAVERRERVVGAENVGRSVDQEDVVAFLRVPGNGGSALNARCGFAWHGFRLNT